MRKVFWVLFLFYIAVFAYADIRIKSVDEAIRIGLENNREIKTKLLEIMSANASIKSSFADLVLPSLNLSFKFSTFDPATLERGITKVSSVKIVTNVVTNVFGVFTNLAFQMEEKVVTNVFWDNYSLGIGIAYRVPYLAPFGLDLGFNSYWLQVRNRELVELQYQKLISEYIHNVKLAYYNYLFAKELSKIAIETDRRLEENVRIAEANFKAGIFSDLELIRAKVQLANNKPALFSSQNNVRLQKINLLLLLGIDVSKVDEVEIDGNVDEVKREFLDEVISFDEGRRRVIENNLDLKILRKLVDIAKVSKDVSLSANKPTFSLFFNYSYEFKKTNSMDNERVWTDSWVAGFQVNIPISELVPISKSYANMESADYSVQRAEYNYANALNSILGQLEQVRLKCSEGLENIRAQKANVEQARRFLEIITTRYRFGSASTLDLIDAQIAYQQAEVNLLSAWISYTSSALGLRKLLGEVR
ncbi:MAG: TolC family protein [Brevinematia bacterium]